MGRYTIENEKLKAVFQSLGGELISLVKKENGQEYIWNGDERYWTGRSPLLFPLVGGLKNNVYTHQGKTYEMAKHGFARRRKFEVKEQKEEEIWFSLTDDEKTRESFPFSFQLEIGYQLQGEDLKVLWRVENTGEEMMYFSIGGHPAFLCPPGGEKPCWQGGYIGCDARADYLEYRLVDLSSGLAAPELHIQPLVNGMFKVEKDTFDRDALMIENGQVKEIFLADEHRVPYLSVRFDMPLAGIWSPIKKDAPFICIEPWCGRCDAVDFAGEWKDRAYGNQAAPGEVFCSGYTISVK